MQKFQNHHISKIFAVIFLICTPVFADQKNLETDVDSTIPDILPFVPSDYIMLPTDVQEYYPADLSVNLNDKSSYSDEAITSPDFSDILNLTELPHIPPVKLRIFKAAYPDLDFTTAWDEKVQDYKITVTHTDLENQKTPYEISKDFYWCGGSLLPEEELANKDMYWPILYNYERELKDPSVMTEEEKEILKEMSSRENRRNGPGTPMFFYDFVYSSYSQRAIEKHIKRTTFLGKSTSVHERIFGPLKKVESRIYELAKTDDEVKTFVSKVKSADAFHWRLIDGTNRKSFHSLGIAVDIMPVRITGEIFWSWARDKNPKGWMLTPLKRRWLPPEQVVNIFEEEGFIWGGRWLIWDNMHFEYHPELLIQ